MNTYEATFTFTAKSVLKISAENMEDALGYAREAEPRLFYDPSKAEKFELVSICKKSEEGEKCTD